MIHLSELPVLAINWHTFFRYAGQAAMLLFLFVYCRRHRPRVHWLWVVTLAVFFTVAGLTGARLFSILNMSFTYAEAPRWELLFQPTAYGSFRWYGSMLLYILFLPFLLRLMPGESRWPVFDLFALALCVFIVFIKQGCQFAADGCYGVPTTLPWGMYYEWGERPSLLPVHPTPVYDSLFHAFFFLYLIRRHRRAAVPEGQTGLVFFTGTSIFSFLLEFVRNNPPVALGLTLAQWTFLAVLLLTARVWQYYARTHTNRSPAPGLPERQAGAAASFFHF